MISLLLRNLIFTILQPGIVVGLLPYLLVRYEGKNLLPDVWTVWEIAGVILMIPGIIILLVCILRFAFEGKGTLSPIDPTQKLVVKGLYVYSRNPMYTGAMLTLTGEAIFFRSWLVAVYAVLVFIAFNLFVRFHEEPRLRRDFGDEYKEYCRRVRRWL